MAELVRMKSKSLEAQLVDKNSRYEYLRQYYLRNKDKDADYRSEHAASRASYERQYYLQNKDKKAEYQIRNQEWIEDLKGQYVRKKLKRDEKGTFGRDTTKVIDRRVEAVAEYRRQYYRENPDKMDIGLRRKNGEFAHQRYLESKKSKLIDSLIRSDGRTKGTEGRGEAVAEYHRQYSLEKPEKKNVADSRGRNGEFFRQYYLENKNRKENLRTDDDRAKQEKRRQYSLQNIERNIDYHIRHGETKSRSRKRQYNFQNKEKVAEYRQEYYNRERSLGGENRRLGRKEYVRSYFGSQRSWRSWKTPERVREYLDSIASRLNISNFEDWYRISRKQLADNGGLSLYEKFGSLGAALQFVFPEIKWDLGVFSHRGKKSGQRWLKLAIKELLPGTDIVEDYQHPELIWVGDSDRNMELDLWIPQHRVGIEFQGQQHYYNIDRLGPSSASGAYSERDTMKHSMCESRGITLIAIPYWWDGSMESLSATLYQARPDVFPVSHGSPIPRERPALAHENRARQLPNSYHLKNIE